MGGSRRVACHIVVGVWVPIWVHSTRPAMAIRQIGQRSIDRITSAQVITTVTSGIKELLDNALDAGATAVDVRVVNHGQDGFSVQDNGSGIAESDFALLAVNHATSKIAEFADLGRITTLGFRGEALASLCVMGQLVVTTNTDAGGLGFRLEFDHRGTVVSKTRVPFPRGTLVEVTQLFADLRSRRLQLEQTIDSQYKKLLSLLQEYAMFTPARLTVENIAKNQRHVALRSQGADLTQRIATVFRGQRSKQVTQVKFTEDDLGVPLEITGVLSKPVPGASDRSAPFQFVAINGRPIKHKKISDVVKEVFRQAGMGDTPLYILDIHLDPSKYDVNVAPDKRSVLFHGEEDLLQGLRTALSNFYTSAEHVIPREPPVKRMRQSLLSFASFAGGGSLISQGRSPRETGETMAQPEIETEGAEELAEVDTVSGAEESAVREPVESANSEPRTDWQAILKAELGMNPPDEDEGVEEEGEAEESEADESEEGGIVETEESEAVQGVAEQRGVVQGEGIESEAEESEAEESEAEESGVEENEAEENEAEKNEAEENEAEESEEEESEAEESEAAQVHEQDIEEAHEGEEESRYDNGTPEEPLEVSEALVKSEPLDLPPPEQSAARPSSRLTSARQKTLNSHIHLPLTVADIEREAQASNNAEPRKHLLPWAVDEQDAEERLQLTIHKNDFAGMEIVGQFNLGFILVVSRKANLDDLFVIDQHASDEIYNFEKLQQRTVMNRQPLVVPFQLELSAVEELVIQENLSVFENNGFSIKIDRNNAPGKQCFLTSVPYSKSTLFDETDVLELLTKLKNGAGTPNLRCSKLRAMFAMRACRSSIMIGQPLKMSRMQDVVRHMGTLDRPWNCPHGRPTLRHITTLK